MMKATLLASPVSGRPLFEAGESYITDDGSERYDNRDGIVNLLSENLLDDAARHEIDSFQTNPVIGTCYFRKRVFAMAARRLRQATGPADDEFRFAELGGGEGYLARYIAEIFESRNVYVCDICRRYLEIAPESLRRVCCDVRFGVFQAGSLDAAAFWVSLHHFSRQDARRCISAIHTALRPGGVLMLFEPNGRFLPRRLMMRLPALRRKVYFDEEEKHLCLDDCLDLTRSLGFTEIGTHFINPPYAWSFIRKLRAGACLFLATEVMHLCDRVGISAVVNATGSLVGNRDGWGLYFFTLLRKT